MTQVTVYQTNVNGIYMHEVVANELALSPGTYNVPYGAKLNSPGEIPQGKAALAVGENWTFLDDHRQDTFYRVDTGEQYQFDTAIAVDSGVVRYVGVGEVPAWLTTTPPEPEEAPAE